MPLPGDAMYRAVAISSAAYSDMFADELAASSAKTTRRASAMVASASASGGFKAWSYKRRILGQGRFARRPLQ